MPTPPARWWACWPVRAAVLLDCRSVGCTGCNRLFCKPSPTRPAACWRWRKTCRSWPMFDTAAQDYHERSKHRLERYSAGPETLDWDAQPDPFRRYVGAALCALPLKADALTMPWAELFEPGRIAPQAFNRDAIGLLFELSLALSAWKQHGPDRWAVRVNPSSGNLHPTEGWLICRNIDDIHDGIHHYAVREHALEQRASFAPQGDTTNRTARAFVALTSIQWREAWKYGERAFRY